jgi:hypothetical protein
MPEILLVFDKLHEYSEAIEDELVRELRKRGERIRVIPPYRSVELAQLSLPGEACLVITALHLRKTSADPRPNEGEGAQLIAWMNRERMTVPAVLVVPVGVETLGSAQPFLQNCYVVREGADVVRETVTHAIACLRDVPPKCLDVEIRLISRTEWMCGMTGRGFVYTPKARHVMVRENDVQLLETLSNGIAESRTGWERSLEQTGRKVLDFLSEDRDWNYDLATGIVQAGGPANTRVKFIVPPELHRVAFEAVLCPQAPDQYWMLNAPVYRHLDTDVPITRSGLFSGQETDCLIIDAAASGSVTVNGAQVRLRPIPSVHTECDSLKAWLEGASAECRIGKVELLRAEAGKPSLREQVKNALESRAWTIVHFAGHAYYDSAHEPGWVFFPGVNTGEVDKEELPRLSGWLRRCTFTYMSCCDAAAGAFVFKLAEQKVVNILGFRWEIEDSLASDFAAEFYPALFKSRSTERAFLKARKAMYDHHRDDRIWAAPILIDQLGEP